MVVFVNYFHLISALIYYETEYVRVFFFCRGECSNVLLHAQTTRDRKHHCLELVLVLSIMAMCGV